MQDFPQSAFGGGEAGEHLSSHRRRDGLGNLRPVLGDTPDPFSLAGLQHELKILEKVDGKWKLSCVSVLKPSQQFLDCPVVQVDALARVLWINELARTRIRRHPGLTISAGTLRARSRTSDRDLRAAIRMGRRPARTRCISRRPDQRLCVTGGALPVILRGRRDHGLCWVRVEGGLILVSFDDEAAVSTAFPPPQ